MRRIETLVALAACACLCAALSACAATPTPKEKSAAPQATSEPRSDVKKAAVPAEAPLHEGKEEVTVLVLNGCGIEGAAEEAAEKIRGLGFKNVATDNATYFNAGFTHVSYHYEDHWDEVAEIMGLFGLDDPQGRYRYDDEWTGGWGMEYDILVMVGDPSAAGNPVYVSGSPN